MMLFLQVGKIATIRLLDRALVSLQNLVDALTDKSKKEFDHVIKWGEELKCKMLFELDWDKNLEHIQML